MIANRPDWICRASAVGVQYRFCLPRTGELHPRTLELLERVAQRVEQGGIEAWQSVDTKELLGAEAEHCVKIKDTLDVWFDSGSTHQTVLGGPDGHATACHRTAELPPAICTSRARTSIAGGSIPRCWCHAC
jgi:isoleucyl-tRNA synthetase